MDRERTFLRTFAIASAIGVTYIASSAFKQTGNHKFAELDVERINIVEPDGTVKMIITNVDRFPNGTDKINGRKTKNVVDSFMMGQKVPMVIAQAYP